jgi:hypothetical protein
MGTRMSLRMYKFLWISNERALLRFSPLITVTYMSDGVEAN